MTVGTLTRVGDLKPGDRIELLPIVEDYGDQLDEDFQQSVWQAENEYAEVITTGTTRSRAVGLAVTVYTDQGAYSVPAATHVEVVLAKN